mgnify:FL=1
MSVQSWCCSWGSAIFLAQTDRQSWGISSYGEEHSNKAMQNQPRTQEISYKPAYVRQFLQFTCDPDKPVNPGVITGQDHRSQLLEEGVSLSHLEKGRKYAAANYLTESLTCVTSNIMEHNMLTSQLMRFACLFVSKMYLNPFVYSYVNSESDIIRRDAYEVVIKFRIELPYHQIFDRYMYMYMS